MAAKVALRAVPAETAEQETKNSHGGVREGAGRKPKALIYAPQIAAAENQIVSALPRIIDKLIDQAEGGDVAAARYLIDRVFGRISEQARPPAEDTQLPYNEEDAERERASRTAEAELEDALRQAF